MKLSDDKVRVLGSLSLSLSRSLRSYKTLTVSIIKMRDYGLFILRVENILNYLVVSIENLLRKQAILGGPTIDK